jgi:hypothetical protein
MEDYLDAFNNPNKPKKKRKKIAPPKSLKEVDAEFKEIVKKRKQERGLDNNGD